MTKEQAMANHWRLLGHKGYGITELRIFTPIMPMVAYADNEDTFIGLCLEMEGKTSGIYVGVQPRPLWLFDKAPNCWKPARSGPNSNCGHDKNIEFITTGFWDIDVVSAERVQGHPASDEELLQSFHAAQLLSREDGLALSSNICCSGNGHYVIVSIVPIPVDSNEVAVQFRNFCLWLVGKVSNQVSGVKFDSVFNLSRVMRVIGTMNNKGQPAPGRPHRRAHIITKSVLAISNARSRVLHHMILNTEFDEPYKDSGGKVLPKSLRCDLQKLEKCQFIRWSRAYPEHVSEPAWWALITNLVQLEGGIPLIHEISKLDKYRYDYSDTERVIQRVINSGYKPVLCKTLISESMVRTGHGKFQCSMFERCPARAPMFMAAIDSI
jgi:hypothetical protein